MTAVTARAAASPRSGRPVAVAVAVAVALAAALWTGGVTWVASCDALESALMRWRPPGPGEVAVVTIDRRTLERLAGPGRRVPPRGTWARIVDRLAACEPRTIVLEMGFAAPSPGDRAGDEALAEAIRRSGRTLLAEVLHFDSEVNRLRLLPPIPLLGRAAARTGVVIDTATVPVSFTRRVANFAFTVRDQRRPHLAVEAAAHYLGSREVVIGPDAIRLAHDDPARARTIPLLDVSDRRYAGRSMVSYATVPRMTRVRLAEVLEATDLADLRRRLSGRVVVVAMAQSLLDPASRPTDDETEDEQWGRQRLTPADGCLTALYAQSIVSATLLSNPFRRLAAPLALALLALGLLLARLPPRSGLAVAATLGVAVVALAAGLYRRGVIVDWIAAAGGLAALWGLPALAGLAALARRAAARERELADALARLTPATGTGAAGAAPGRPALGALVMGFLPARYEGAMLLGEGGMGVVYRARDAERGVEVAVKVLSPLARHDVEATRRFVAEARLMQTLTHPAIVRVLDVYVDVLPLFTMELIDGTPLARRLASGTLDPGRAVGVARELAEALAHLHARRVIHRDVKPSNIMLRPDGRPVLLDFGLARAEDRTRITRTGDVMGTIRYMAPEQFAGRAAVPATDVYALALVLCEMLTGSTPERSGTGHAPPRAQLAQAGAPAALIALLERCLAEDPAARPSDGAALAAALAAADKAANA
jgi:CHASE2 domain-containing sensor protein/predicted Ser/Thr protein kinase